jgi:hypothetical protein
MQHSGQLVAVKVLAVKFSDQAVQQAFHRELLLASEIDGHANLVAVRDWGTTADGLPYMAMDYCPGGSLREQVERHGPLPLTDVLDVGVRVSAALAHAHRGGVVHGDVGPHNILTRGDGEPALTDLGVGRLVVHAEGGGGVLSPAYAAPEVLQGRAPTPSSDVYSLGATLFYLLAGRPPYSSLDDPLALIMTGERPELVRADVPQSVARLILRAMSIQPDDRFPNAAALVTALQGQQRELGLTMGEPGRTVTSTVVGDRAATERSWPAAPSRPVQHRAHRAQDSPADAEAARSTHDIRRPDDQYSTAPSNEPSQQEPPRRALVGLDDQAVPLRTPLRRRHRLRWRLAAVTIALLVAAIASPALLINSNYRPSLTLAAPTPAATFTDALAPTPETIFSAEPTRTAEATPTPTPSYASPTSNRQTSATRLVDPSGQAMPVGDLPGWHQIFTEDFATDAAVGSFSSIYGTRWQVYGDGSKDNGNGLYFPSKVLSVANGLLNIHIHTENGIHMGGAVVAQLPGLTAGLTYGRFTIRIRADSLPGFSVSATIWPDSDQSGEGFILFPDGDLDNTIHWWVNYAQPGGPGEGQDTSTTFTQWHTATTEWSPGDVKFIFDNRVVGDVTTGVPSTPHHLVIQTDTCSCQPTASAGDVQVDWVAIYAPA